MSSTADTQRVVVIGAGFGGQAVCEALKNKVPSESVTVIDSSDTLSIAATWQYALNDRAAPLVIPLADTVAAKHFTLLAGSTVTKLDTAARSISLENGSTVSYDYLVLAPGAISDPTPIPGLAECAIDITVQSSMSQVKQSLSGLSPGSTVLIAITKTPYKCPPLPFEFAFIIDEILASLGKRDSVRIVVTCPVPWPFGGPGAAKVFKDTMTSKNIEFIPEVSVASMAKGNEGKITVCYDADNADIEADLVLATYPHRAPDFVMQAEMVNPKGSVPVDLRSNRVLKGIPEGEKSVFCVGDTCAAVLPAIGAPMPKAGELAWQAGLAVGDIIAANIAGAPEVLPLTRKALCTAESGYGHGIIVGPDFSAAFSDPAEGKPLFNVTPVPVEGGGAAKVEWINAYAGLMVGDTSQAMFNPTIKA